MRNRLILCASLLMITPCLSDNIAQAQTRIRNDQLGNRPSITADRVRSYDRLALARPNRRAGFALMPSHSAANVNGAAFNISPMAAGPNLVVLGSGTLGRLTKWTGLTSSNSFIGDSTIFESKLGLVGIGTDTPTSKLTVAGTIQSLTGGFQFPDGTVQTTAGIAANQVVRSLNGLMGDLTLVPGANVSITPGANSLTIAASGLLSGVSHDATLMGEGTIGSALGVAIPLILTGSVKMGGVIEVTNTAQDGWGIAATGGASREGVNANGGDSNDGFGGNGVIASGGFSLVASGGAGVQAFGGRSDGATGGVGVRANGGNSNSGDGGIGAVVNGGNGDSSGLGGDGVRAFGGFGTGAMNTGGIGVFARRGLGFDGATPGLAGRFEGDVEVTGNLSKGGGSFKIDHPLDPENKYLYHSFVESPDMKNIYDGNVVTDENGEATVTLPNYFEALNRDFRYQLTVLGTFAQAIVAEKIKGNRFVIRTNSPNVEVSWQVTGTRQDPWAKKNRIQVEVEKTNGERGFYLHPEAFNQPDERGIEWAQNPALMQRPRQQRIDSKQKPNDK